MGRVPTACGVGGENDSKALFPQGRIGRTLSSWVCPEKDGTCMVGTTTVVEGAVGELVVSALAGRLPHWRAPRPCGWLTALRPARRRRPGHGPTRRPSVVWTGGRGRLLVLLPVRFTVFGWQSRVSAGRSGHRRDGGGRLVVPSGCPGHLVHATWPGRGGRLCVVARRLGPGRPAAGARRMQVLALGSVMLNLASRAARPLRLAQVSAFASAGSSIWFAPGRAAAGAGGAGRVPPGRSGPRRGLRRRGRRSSPRHRLSAAGR